MKKNKQEKQMIDANKILDQIICATLTRHIGVPSETFLKEFGLLDTTDVNSAENKFLLEAKFKFLNECTKEMLRLNDSLKMIQATINLLKGETKNEQEEQ